MLVVHWRACVQKKKPHGSQLSYRNYAKNLRYTRESGTVVLKYCVLCIQQFFYCCVIIPTGNKWKQDNTCITLSLTLPFIQLLVQLICAAWDDKYPYTLYIPEVIIQILTWVEDVVIALSCRNQGSTSFTHPVIIWAHPSSTFVWKSYVCCSLKTEKFQDHKTMRQDVLEKLV